MDNKELLALCEKATPGPWEYLGKASGYYEDGEMHPFVLGPNGENPICHIRPDWEQEQENAEFIAASRTELPRLVRENEALREVVSAGELLWPHVWNVMPPKGRFRQDAERFYDALMAATKESTPSSRRPNDLRNLYPGFE